MGERSRHVAQLDPTLGPPPQELYLAGREMFGPDNRGGAVVLLEPLADDQPAVPEILRHRRARVRRGALGCKASRRIFWRIQDWLRPIRACRRDHLVPLQMVDGLEHRIPRFPPYSRSRFLFENVLDAEKDVAEAGLSHQQGEPVATADVVA